MRMKVISKAPGALSCWVNKLSTKIKEIDMSAMKSAIMDVQDMLDAGARPTTIAAILGMPINFVYDVANLQSESAEAEVLADLY